MNACDFTGLVHTHTQQQSNPYKTGPQVSFWENISSTSRTHREDSLPRERADYRGKFCGLEGEELQDVSWFGGEVVLGFGLSVTMWLVP